MVVEIYIHKRLIKGFVESVLGLELKCYFCANEVKHLNYQLLQYFHALILIDTIE